MKSNTQNAVFLQRLAAYLIDVILIGLCVSLISSPFINTTAVEKINSQLQDVAVKLQNSDISYMSYIREVAVLGLESGKLNGVSTIITIVLEILYFVVFQIYNSGQTIGKKILKIKVVSKDGELTMNQMIGRSLLVNSILLSMISIVVISFVSNPMQYLYINGSFESIQYIFYLVTVLMVMFRKDHVSLHDFITNTRVVKL